MTISIIDDLLSMLTLISTVTCVCPCGNIDANLSTTSMLTLMTLHLDANVNASAGHDSKVKTKGTPLWGTHRLKILKHSFATITNVIGSTVN